MGLTVPDTDELADHMHVGSINEVVDEVEWAEEALQLASDLLSIATGLEDDPDTGLGKRMVRIGTLAMAHALIVQFEDREAAYSPFQSERLGSYSYSKMAQAAKDGNPLGVPLFDLAVEYLQGGDDDASEISIHAETVFTRSNPADSPQYAAATNEALWPTYYGQEYPRT